ncbi:MAG: hypothetical protein VB835_05460, partial [Pirellulales bacterium]
MKRFTQWTLTLTLAAQVVIGLTGTVHAQIKSYNSSKSNTSINTPEDGTDDAIGTNDISLAGSGRTQTIYYFAKEVKAGALNDIPAG